MAQMSNDDNPIAYNEFLNDKALIEYAKALLKKEGMREYQPPPPRPRDAYNAHVAVFVFGIMNLFKNCTSSTITIVQYNDFSKRIAIFNESEHLFSNGDFPPIQEHQEISATWEIFKEAKFSALTQGLLETVQFTAGMNKIGLLPHEATLMLNANDNEVSFSKLNIWLLKLPPTYNLMPTTQRYKDSCTWSRAFVREFTNRIDRHAEMPEIFAGAQFQAATHGITLDRSDWIK